MTEEAFGAAADRAVAEEMRQDPRVFAYGLEPPAALEAEFGAAGRVFRAPVSENALVGVAVGAAGCGMRPVFSVGNVTFGFVAFDQMVNQAAKLRYMFGGQRDFSLVLRLNYGGGEGLGAQHSQSPYAIFSHVPGLKVVVPSGAADAYGLMKTAVRDGNPVFFFEGVRLARLKEDVPVDAAPIPFGRAAIKRSGSDVTVVAIGYMVRLALEAAAAAAQQGIEVEVVDPRTLVPFDAEAIRTSVRKTGRLVVVDEAPPTCSMAAEIGMLVAEDRETLAALKAPIRRVCGATVPVPYSPPLEDFVLPNAVRIGEAISAIVERTPAL